MNNTPANSKTTKFGILKSAGLIITVIVGSILALILIYAALASIRGDTRPILSVANKFKPAASWQIQADTVTPPLIFCIGGVRCPSVHRSWAAGDLTGDEFKAILGRIGWNFPIEGDCDKVPPGGGSAVMMCSAKGKVDGFDIQVRISGTASNLDERFVGLSVE